jgi:hypothetical protein
MATSAAHNNQGWVIVNPKYFNDGFELIGHDEAREAAEEGIGQAAAVKANRAAAYAPTICKNTITATSYIALNAVWAPPSTCAAAGEGIAAERFSNAVMDTRVGHAVTWFTAFTISAITACFMSAYLTAQTRGPNTAANPSIVGITRAAYHYQPVVSN